MKSVIAESLQTPAPYERRGKTRAEEAAELGISVQWLRKLRAKERAGEAEYAADVPGPERDESDLPHLAITYDSGRERGDWYEPESGRSSVDRGYVRIGDHNGRRLLVRAVNGGRKAEEQTRQHKPDPAGLNGGLGSRKRKRKRKRPVPAA